MSLCRSSAVLLALVLGLLPAWSTAAVHRCTVQGTVTFQAQPCSQGDSRPPPTVEQLNAERQKRLRSAAEAPPRAASAVPAAPPGRCDGRRFCSQMTSCAEAKYFLAHCPGVQMDGDGDGIPCEQQWCPR